MGIPKDIIELESIKDMCILLGYRGSISHGTYKSNKNPNSIDDKDAMGICIPSIEYYYGLKTFGSRGTVEIKEDVWDIVLYEYRKAIRLLEKGNPNIMALLWLAPQYYINVTGAGQMLIDNRDLFVGKHVYHSFVGYAYGQLHRMTHMACKGYMGEKRKRLVEKYGFDTKNAAHLVRILRMGIEFLNDGELYVLRKDAQQLLEIKAGEWTLEKVKAEAERLFIVAELAYTHSKLPVKPDHERVNKLCVDIAKCWGISDNNREER